MPRKKRKSKTEILRELIAQQEKDLSHHHQYREIITPLKCKPYPNLSKTKKQLIKQAIIILRKCNYTVPELGGVLKLSQSTLWRYISETYEEL